MPAEPSGHLVESRNPGIGTGAGPLGTIDLRSDVHPSTHGIETPIIGTVGTGAITGAGTTGIEGIGTAVTGVIRTGARGVTAVGMDGFGGSSPARAADSATGRGVPAARAEWEGGTIGLGITETAPARAAAGGAAGCAAAAGGAAACADVVGTAA